MRRRATFAPFTLATELPFLRVAGRNFFAADRARVWLSPFFKGVDKLCTNSPPPTTKNERQIHFPLCPLPMASSYSSLVLLPPFSSTTVSGVWAFAKRKSATVHG